MLRELAHGVGGAFACIARVLDPAVRHLVGSERGRLVHGDAAELEPSGRAHGRSDVGREDSGLKAIARAVRQGDRLVERCEELIELEGRLGEIDALLSTSAAIRRPPAARCACGTPLFRGSHFCPNCGRPALDAPVVACASCGAALAAEARFCASCGAATPGSEDA